MKGALIVIPVDPKAAVTRQELTAAPRLEALKRGIGGGYIEVVPHFTRYQGERCVAFCDENGKLDSLPVNQRATRLWFDQLEVVIHDYLVGPIVIVAGDRELMEEL